MNAFWIGAVALAVVAAMVVIAPIIISYARHGDGKPVLTLGIGAGTALALPVIALALYSHWNNYDWSGNLRAGAGAGAAPEDAAHAMDEAIVGLRERLAANPRDAEGWQLLGRSYMATQDFVAAADAYRRAVEVLEPDVPMELRADYAEALVFTEEGALQNRSLAIFEAILEESPEQPKALWYVGLAASERNDLALARVHWEPLLELNPPEQIERIIRERLAMQDVAPAPAQAAASMPEAPPPPEGAIQLQISLAPDLASRVAGDAPLFIFARAGVGGPPLAVLRNRASDLPLVVNLSDENTMIEGTSLADHAKLTLVARVALNGSPAAQPGDLFGEVSYDRADGQTTAIQIDRVVE